MCFSTVNLMKTLAEKRSPRFHRFPSCLMTIITMLMCCQCFATLKLASSCPMIASCWRRNIITVYHDLVLFSILVCLNVLFLILPALVALHVYIYIYILNSVCRDAVFSEILVNKVIESLRFPFLPDTPSAPPTYSYTFSAFFRTWIIPFEFSQLLGRLEGCKKINMRRGKQVAFLEVQDFNKLQMSPSEICRTPEIIKRPRIAVSALRLVKRIQSLNFKFRESLD